MRLVLLGDVMLGRLVNEHLRKAPAAYPWGDTLPVLRAADLRFANLECVLADGGQPQPRKVFHFRSDLKNVETLKAAGIDVVSLANNHVLDFGVDAFRETPDVLDLAGILHAGAGLNLETARHPAIMTAGSTTVGFLAFTDNQPDWEAAPHHPGVYYVPVDAVDRRTSGLLELVRHTKAMVDILVVSAHWGPNWGAEVPPAHQALGRALVEAGADVVFGHSATSSAAWRSTRAGPSSTAPAISWTTMPWTRRSETTSPSSSGWRPTTACRLCSGSIPPSSPVSRRVWREGSRGRSPSGCSG
ncbi:uncharacterized protein Rv0574c/MT0602 [Arthrobacter sp. Hiyo6]|nr:uncharacterized protein Rv0574c/MT0602 [Arthrobacter sp. Hiyo6]